MIQSFFVVILVEFISVFFYLKIKYFRTKFVPEIYNF